MTLVQIGKRGSAKYNGKLKFRWEIEFHLGIVQIENRVPPWYNGSLRMSIYYFHVHFLLWNRCCFAGITSTPITRTTKTTAHVYQQYKQTKPLIHRPAVRPSNRTSD
jgi:hypothetical protein